ncbi:hypothetical protein Tco_1200499 [Tanacetum coccineum]
MAPPQLEVVSSASQFSVRVQVLSSSLGGGRNKSVDYLSQGKDELIDLRKKKLEAKKAPKSSNKQTLPAKHEEFMDDLITKLKDEGDGIIDPFKIVESKVEKYRIHDVDTHWRIRKPQVGGKFVNVDQLKECLTYYALSNGFSLWFYTSSKTKLIAKCGLRPEKLKEQEKEKQRKWKRYQSTSTSEVEGSNCPWRCYGKEMTNEKSFQVISMTDEHSCEISYIETADSNEKNSALLAQHSVGMPKDGL